MASESTDIGLAVVFIDKKNSQDVTSRKSDDTAGGCGDGKT